MVKRAPLKLEDILYSDEGQYGYLFPYRDRVPKIKHHIFSDLKRRKETTSHFVGQQLLDTDQIGWTVKVILGLDLFPVQVAILRAMWKHPFPMLIASRGGSKSFIVAIYAILRAILDPGTKIVIVGAGLRQAKLVFNYIDAIWQAAPVLRNIVGGGKNAGPRQNVDLCYFKIGASIIYALPMGDGTKIRGFRANVVIADEFASIPEDIFDVVVRGFAATSKTPVDAARRLAIEKRLKNLDVPDEIGHLMSDDNKKVQGNQIVYSGTAYYAFNHFAKRYDMWIKIIASRGEPDKVAAIFGGPNLVPDNFDYRDYVVIQLPYTHLPPGLLDEKQLAHAKALLPKNIFLMEYAAIFVRDSDGFYPRSLIEACTVRPSQPFVTADGPVVFTPLMQKANKCKYVIGIDPAAEQDHLAIVVMEVWPNHYRVVYCWSINKKEFNKRKREGLVTDDDYYAYCCGKIREVVRKFGPVSIEMDSQGGGYPISEMLRNKKLLEEDEFPIYETIDYDDPKDTDHEEGLHILNLIQQSNPFNAEANVCLHKSLETKRLLFPAFDTVKMQAALVVEKSMNVTFDTYEENVGNIEELKNELCTIQMSETATGKERFDTPSVISAGSVEGRQRRGRLRKDRYTALLLAHKYVYDRDVKPDAEIDYENVAGNIQQVKADKDEGLYRGPGIGQMRNAGWTKTGTGGVGGIQGGERI